MQSYDWNALKHVIALYRFGRLTTAAHHLGASDTTVARKVRAFEMALGVSLFLKSPSGRFEPTDACLQILSHAEAIEAQHFALAERACRAGAQVSGAVRISSVPMVVNGILVPNLEELLQAHPNLTVELVPSASNLDLSKREADLAIRFAKPEAGGLRIKAQKLGVLAFKVYAPRSLPEGDQEQLNWITYDDTCAGLPQARWLEAAAARDGRRAAIRVTDIETAREATARGIGKTLLPALIADGDPRLRNCRGPMAKDMPTRELWMLSHVDQEGRASVSAVKTWLRGLAWNAHTSNK